LVDLQMLASLLYVLILVLLVNAIFKYCCCQCNCQDINRDRGELSPALCRRITLGIMSKLSVKWHLGFMYTHTHTHTRTQRQTGRDTEKSTRMPGCQNGKKDPFALKRLSSQTLKPKTNKRRGR